MHLKSLFFLLLLTAAAACSPKVNNTVVDNKLQDLLDRREFFKLKEELVNGQAELTEDRILYYNIFLKNAFGERDASNRDITNFLQKHAQTLSDTMLVKLLEIQASNHLYLYQYKAAADVYHQIRTQHARLLDSTDVSNYSNVERLFGAIADVAPQTMTNEKDVLLNTYRNDFNHLMTPVRVDTVKSDFIFDTGANLSTITESEAKRMNLRLIEQNVDIGTATQIEVQSKLAVADSFFVGDILFQNVVFIVMPDEQLTFPQIDYAIKGIIGFPVIHMLGEIHLNKDGRTFIPKVPSVASKQNMFLTGLNPVVEVLSGADTLMFTLDTGAMRTELSFKYYTEHKAEVERAGEFQTNERGGAGGGVEVKEYMLSNFPITIGRHLARIDEVPVTLEEYDFNKYFDGNMGQDVFMQFNSLVINFKGMYLDFE